MIIVFTLLDAVVLGITVLSHFNVLESLVPLALAALYLFFKGVVFFGDIASFVDVLVAVYLVLMLLGVRWKLTALVVLWLANKIVASFLG